MLENKVLRKPFGDKEAGSDRAWEKLRKMWLHNLYYSKSII
jgi:hypothetical protein